MSSLLKAKFPLYAMRAYEAIELVEPYRIIQTHRTKYVLDCTYLAGSFAERRLELFSRLDTLPYPLYPLKLRYSTYAQVLKSKSKVKTFMDADGNILKYKPTKFVPLKCTRIKTATRTQDGDYMAWTDLPVGMRIKANKWDGNLRYIRYIEWGGSPIFYDAVPNLVSDTRIKI